MINKKIKFIKFLLHFFKNESFFVKIYFILRMIIFPIGFFEEVTKIFKNKSIVDIGCGYGISILYLLFKGYENNILGLDIDKKRIEILRKYFSKYKNIDFQKRDLIKEGFDTIEKYEVGLMVDILHHLDKETQNNLLIYLSKHIKTLVIKDIDIYPKYKYFWNYFHDRYLMRNKILCFQGSKVIKYNLEGLGYTVSYKKIKSFFPYPHYLLIAQK